MIKLMSEAEGSILRRFMALRNAPEIVALRERVKHGEDVACSEEHKEDVLRVFDPDEPFPDDEQLDTVSDAATCKECILIVALVSNDPKMLK